MPSSGRWSQQIGYKNCGKKLCLQGCADDPGAKPHGPYASLRRRNPDDTGQQDSVYLGKDYLSDDQLDLINQIFAGPQQPTKTEILHALGIMEKKRPAHLSGPSQEGNDE